MILPSTHEKYPGRVWEENKPTCKKRFRAYYTLEEPDPVSKKKKVYLSCTTYEEGFNFILAQSEFDGHGRVKNKIFKIGDSHYECDLTQDKKMLFDEEDLALVQNFTWRYHTQSGHVLTNKHEDLPSTLFHICALGKPDAKHEVAHLNGVKRDNRRSNIKVVPRHH